MWVVVENHNCANYIHLTLLPPCLSHITPSSLLTPPVLLGRPFPLFYETLVLPQGHSLPGTLIEERGRELKVECRRSCCGNGLWRH